MESASPRTAERQLPDSIFADLMTAILAVNRCSIERAYAVVQRFSAVGTSDAASVAVMDIDTVAERLHAAELPWKWSMAYLLAPRVLSAASVLASGGMGEISNFERSGDVEGLTKFLLSIHGVGPVVVHNFLLLRERSGASRTATDVRGERPSEPSAHVGDS